MIYLACPYTHEHDYIQHQRYEEVTRMAAILMREGNIIYSPITSMHYLSRHMTDVDHSFWLRHDLAILSRCDKMIVLQLEGWKESKGLKEEIAHATHLNIPIVYIWSR